MTRKGPLITLLGGGVFAVALLAASVYAANAPLEDDPVLAGGSAAPTEEPPDEPGVEEDEDEDVEAEEAEAITYVGYIDGGGASVAIIVTGDEATAYVCDGSEIEVWLSGTASDGELNLAGGQGETLTATFDGEAATGETAVAGRDWTFALAGAEAPEGLYRFADTIIGGAEVDGGWIVLPDGTQVGVLTVDGVARPAPRLDPVNGAVTVEGYRFTAQRLGGS